MHAAIHQCILRYVTLLVNILLAVTAHILLLQISDELEPYHTSALSGQEWVIKLIISHPERIRYELGVHVHVFERLINELCALGHADSHYVSLEE